MARLGPLTIGLPEIAITAAFVLPLIGATLPTALKVAGDPIGSATQLLTGLTRALATTDVEQETDTIVIASDALNKAAGNKQKLGACGCKEGSTPNIVDLHDGDCVCVPIKNSGISNGLPEPTLDPLTQFPTLPTVIDTSDPQQYQDIIEGLYSTGGISGGLGR